jgi:hypothetical protein
VPSSEARLLSPAVLRRRASPPEGGFFFHSLSRFTVTIRWDLRESADNHSPYFKGDKQLEYLMAREYGVLAPFWLQ